MGEFLDVARRELHGRLDKFDLVFRAIAGLQRVHSKAQLDIHNIESIFTVLELGRVIQKVPGLEPEEIEPTIQALRELIASTIESTLRFPTLRGKLGVPPPYDNFIELIKKIQSPDGYVRRSRTASIVTFNYDIALDWALLSAGLQPNYGLPGNEIEASQSVPLLKLHGSLNWAVQESPAKPIRSVNLRKYVQERRWGDVFSDRTEYVSVSVSSNLKECFSDEPIEVQKEPLIVPPSWNKADYHSALSDVWAAAARHLTEASQIFVIGYSLPETDAFFRHLFALGSEGGHTLERFAVFNPDETGSVEHRFRSLLGSGALNRFKYHQCYFDAAIGEIGGMIG